MALDFRLFAHLKQKRVSLKFAKCFILYTLIFLQIFYFFFAALVSMSDQNLKSKAICSDSPQSLGEPGNVKSSNSARMLSVQEIIQYFFVTNSSSCKLSVDFGFSLGKSETFGMAPDGFKSVCLDLGIRPTFNNCLVYSFGVRDDWSFEEEMEKYGCDVYAFDPTTGKEDHQHSKNIWFFDIALGGLDVDRHTRKSWKVRTLSSIYEELQKKHGSRVIDVLKVDIEFSEWKTLDQIYRSGILRKVKQIAMDVHLRERSSLQTLRKCYKMIRSLERDYGFYRFNSRPSPWANVYLNAWGRRGNYAFEMSWYNSQYLNNSMVDPYVFW